MLFELLQTTPYPPPPEPPWEFAVFVYVLFVAGCLVILLVGFLVFRALLRAVFRR